MLCAKPSLWDTVVNKQRNVVFTYESNLESTTLRDLLLCLVRCYIQPRSCARRANLVYKLQARGGPQCIVVRRTQTGDL